MKFDMNVVANNIRMLRLKKRMSQSELAMEVNASRTTIISIEQAKQEPRIRLIYDIAVALDTDVNKLLSREE